MELVSQWTLYKRTGTYADTLAAVGLAKMIDFLLDGEQEVFVSEKSDSFLITSDPVDLSNLDYQKLQARPQFRYAHLSDEDGDIPPNAILYAEQKRLADEEREYKKKNAKAKSGILSDDETRPRGPEPRFPTFQKINLLQGFGARNKLYREIENADPEAFRTTLIQRLMALGTGTDLQGTTPFAPSTSPLQVFNPIAGKGINQTKALSTSRKSLPNDFLDWFEEWLRYIASDIALMGYSMNKDIKMSVPVPKEITFRTYQAMNKEKGTLAWTSRKSDIFAVLDQVGFLLQHAEKESGVRLRLVLNKSPRDLISSIQTTYFKSLGSGRAVTNISSIGVPDWFTVKTQADYDLWKRITDDHRKVLQLWDEDKSEEADLLGAYRDFLSASDWRAFLQFLGGNGILLMKKREKGKPARTFTYSDLEALFLKSQENSKLPIAEVIRNAGFKSVAEAMRKATVTEQFHKSRGNQSFDIHYGLFQEIKQKAKFREQLIERVARFVNEYNAENARRAERIKEGAGRRRANVTLQELEELFSLFDKYPKQTETIAMLLIAFASAKDDTKQQNDEQSLEEEI
ncbi:hypothetical protein EV586_103422 [Tumebacillus sp. BK434]|uniref:hypothetical protein n=1 Tax=Tumebacillus sp. BK434 TaxID=2512169 RepID=UPI00104614B8|nr:hypothetical protein [Tumebacillus sp. BK434]TCP55768.1 hypothetical protein EV586_103422 [Tumebacillus sp. BK434]